MIPSMESMVGMVNAHPRVFVTFRHGSGLHTWLRFLRWKRKVCRECERLGEVWTIHRKRRKFNILWFGYSIRSAIFLFEECINYTWLLKFNFNLSLISATCLISMHTWVHLTRFCTLHTWIFLYAHPRSRRKQPYFPYWNDTMCDMTLHNDFGKASFISK